jgi:hypothetical protein
MRSGLILEFSLRHYGQACESFTRPGVPARMPAEALRRPWGPTREPGRRH